MKILASIALFYFIFSSSSAQATAFVVDSNKIDKPGCGMWRINPCRTYSYLMNKGCDSSGCKDNFKPGDSIVFIKGIYREKINFNLSGSSSKPVIAMCDSAPGDCVIDGSLLQPIPYDALVTIGPARYFVMRGFKIINIPREMYGLALVDESTENILIKNNIIDGIGASNNLFVTGSKSIDYVSFVKNQIINCPAASTGCTFFHESNNLAIVGNHFGPVANSGNYDCNTVVGSSNALIDGNTCKDSADGFDQGMDDGGKFLINVVTRNNRVFGNLKARAFPISGQFENTPSTTNYLTGPNSIYKNVIQTIGGSCLQPYGGAQDIIMAYNTCFNSGGYGSGVWLQSEYDYWVQRIQNKYSIFDSSLQSPLPTILLGSTPKTVRACPSGDDCPFVGNVFYMKERADSYQFASWSPSKLGSGPIYFFTIGMLNGFNGINQNFDNQRMDPMFSNRSDPYQLSHLKLQQGSQLIDKGKPFCNASTQGSGNTISITCEKYSPRVFFPALDMYYRLQSSECKMTGTRVSDAIDYGCYDIQIEDCGIREVTSISGNDIKFSGLPCSWKSGAAVHVPWTGKAPDIGALEYR